MVIIREMYLYISFMLCMLPSANRLMWRPMWGYIPSSIRYLPYSIIVSTRLLFYERRLGLCVFMKLCLVYAISRSWPCKKWFTITHRWEQAQQMCEIRKEIYFSPIRMRSWPSPLGLARLIEISVNWSISIMKTIIDQRNLWIDYLIKMFCHFLQ